MIKQTVFSTEDDGLFEADEAAIIRRKPAYLSKIYREVMVRFYMHGKSMRLVEYKFTR